MPRERRAISADACVLDGASEHLRGAAHDQRERGLVVEVEAIGGAEAVAQRLRHERVPRGRADEREAVELQPDVPRLRPAAEDDVEREVLHRGVERLLDHAREAVHLVDEEDVARLQRRQHRGEVARALDGGPGGDADGDAHLGGEDHRQRGLAEAGRAVDEDVVERLLARERGGDGDAQALLDCLLPEVLRQPSRPERQLRAGFVRRLRPGQRPALRFVHGVHGALLDSRRASIANTRSESDSSWWSRRYTGEVSNYDLVREAVLRKQQVVASYNGRRRRLCPHAIGRKRSVPHALLLPVRGSSSSGLSSDPRANWRCLAIDALRDIEVRDGNWHTADYDESQSCIDEVDVSVEGFEP